jgi:hypothetical protein
MLFFATYAFGFLFWLALGQPSDFLRRAGGVWGAFVYWPAAFALLLLWDVLIERRDARREAAKNRRE